MPHPENRQQPVGPAAENPESGSALLRGIGQIQISAAFYRCGSLTFAEVGCQPGSFGPREN